MLNSIGFSEAFEYMLMNFYRNLRVGMNHTYGYRDTSSYPS